MNQSHNELSYTQNHQKTANIYSDKYNNTTDKIDGFLGGRDDHDNIVDQKSTGVQSSQEDLYKMKIKLKMDQ